MAISRLADAINVIKTMKTPATIPIKIDIRRYISTIKSIFPMTFLPEVTGLFICFSFSIKLVSSILSPA